MFPVDAEGLIYSLTVTQDRLTGCTSPGVNLPITYDIEAAWTGISSHGPPPPPPHSCRGVVCPPGDQCHDPGVCNPATGACSAPTVSEGKPCGVGDFCTAQGKCDAQGSCVPGVSIPCPMNPFFDQCQGVTCDPATGCNYSADGKWCDDGNPCTIDDKCDRGTCQGTPKPCPKRECYSTPKCALWNGECIDEPLVQGSKCRGDSVCEECNGEGQCVPLTQATVDMTCDQLIRDTIALCQGVNNITWRVDARKSTANGGATNYVACEETGGVERNANTSETDLCSHAGAGERQTDYYCGGSVTHISAATDVQCARAKDTTQGVCDAICTYCNQ
jgi:hypothetical protein